SANESPNTSTRTGGGGGGAVTGGGVGAFATVWARTSGTLVFGTVDAELGGGGGGGTAAPSARSVTFATGNPATTRTKTPTTAMAALAQLSTATGRGSRPS